MASRLDANQVLPNAFNDTRQALNVNVVATDTSVTAVDQTIIPYSSINGSGGAKTEFITSLSATATAIHPYDTTGSFLQIYSGPAGATLVCTIGPGQSQPIPVRINAGTKLWIRSQEATAPTDGQLSLLFLG